MYDYREKFKGQDGRNSVYQILYETTFADWETIKTEYDASDIAYIKIDGNTFSNYGQYQFIWEKTFVKSPERSSSGNIGNLNSYATFLTPHLIINFSIMSIDDYRAIMRMHYEKNEFTVECYDFIYNRPIKVKMYFGTEEMAKLYTINKIRQKSNGEWEDWIELVGVQDYSVELIGTNNELDLVSVIYHFNPPPTLGTDRAVGETDIYKGEELVIGASASSITSETFNGRYKFKNWNTSRNPEETNANSLTYLNGYVYTINDTLVLYAQWQETSEHILSYNYGLADPEINDSDYVYVTSKKVAKGQSIGNLPVAEAPKVKYKDIYDGGKDKEKTDVYYNGKWYKTPIKATNSVAVSDNDLYWSNRDSTIYLLYDVTKYNLFLYLDGALYQTNSIEYNTPMNLPQLVQQGKTFDGWYYTSDFKSGTKISGNMPPYPLTLYARWIEK
jgi:uncharacterized repeat protein (TIGR02543 family)